MVEGKSEADTKKVLDKLQKEGYKKWRKQLEDTAINFYSDMIKKHYDLGEIIYIIEFLRIINIEKMQTFIDKRKMETTKSKPNPMVI